MPLIIFAQNIEEDIVANFCPQGMQSQRAAEVYAGTKELPDISKSPAGGRSI